MRRAMLILLASAVAVAGCENQFPTGPALDDQAAALATMSATIATMVPLCFGDQGWCSDVGRERIFHGTWTTVVDEVHHPAHRSFIMYHRLDIYQGPGWYDASAPILEASRYLGGFTTGNSIVCKTWPCSTTARTWSCWTWSCSARAHVGSHRYGRTTQHERWCRSKSAALSAPAAPPAGTV